ncbi:hypothetical protein CDAR_529911 [Caerostris darwini]|uniref:Uncharacterized protein n=1 Tax=Caerostris darwini TaxID=1538125 RepID=A0AAV4QKZ5_9ARAC|nr:hypothetical protein CDAR_529911 [Caerostris darwini]
MLQRIASPFMPQQCGANYPSGSSGRFTTTFKHQIPAMPLIIFLQTVSSTTNQIPPTTSNIFLSRFLQLPVKNIQSLPMSFFSRFLQLQLIFYHFKYFIPDISFNRNQMPTISNTFRQLFPSPTNHFK